MPTGPTMLVLADDLTGAAEIAALGVEHGLSTELATRPASSGAELLVLDTDTRPLSAEEAAAKVTEFLAESRRGGRRIPPIVFKKTDSVLRGQVVAELGAMLRALGVPRALLAPQNPSKGRVIVDGRYLIDGMPLDRTTFRDDPEYPRASARVAELLAGVSGVRVAIASPGDALPPEGITVGNGSTPAEMRQWAARGAGDTLLAGGADLFRAFLEGRGHGRRESRLSAAAAHQTVLLCGSASDYSRGMVAKWAAEGLAVCAMPEGAADAALPWARCAAEALARHGSVILAITHPLSPGRAATFRECMAETVKRLVEAIGIERPLRLVVEGGATAAAVAGAMGWSAFEVAGSLAPGVVLLRPCAATTVEMIIKPGSYPWPDGFSPRRAAELPASKLTE